MRCAVHRLHRARLATSPRLGQFLFQEHSFKAGNRTDSSFVCLLQVEKWKVSSSPSEVSRGTVFWAATLTLHCFCFCIAYCYLFFGRDSVWFLVVPCEVPSVPSVPSAPSAPSAPSVCGFCFFSRWWLQTCSCRLCYCGCGCLYPSLYMPYLDIPFRLTRSSYLGGLGTCSRSLACIWG